MRSRHAGLRITAVACGLAWLLCCGAGPDSGGDATTVRGTGHVAPVDSNGYGEWMHRPPDEWPHIAVINQIDYTDKQYPVAGCGFLLDTGDEVLAATAKHVLTYFKSEAMDAVAFEGTLKQWRMFPKDSPGDLVVLDRLLNEDPGEPLPSRRTSPDRDWLLFTIQERSPKIQPLRLRSAPLRRGETVFVVGWRYTDTDRPQVVYEGRFVKSEGGSILTSIDELTDNTVPGLSGSPVIDAGGYVIGLMSTKAGKLQRASSLDYPKKLIKERVVEDPPGRVPAPSTEQ